MKYSKRGRNGGDRRRSNAQKPRQQTGGCNYSDEFHLATPHILYFVESISWTFLQSREAAKRTIKNQTATGGRTLSVGAMLWL
jgi:hypothetical protein